MLRRYRKLQEDMPLLSGEDRGRYFGKRVFYIKTNVIYLPLSTRQAELAKPKLISFIEVSQVTTPYGYEANF